jgi:hypothetical protein
LNYCSLIHIFQYVTRITLILDFIDESKRYNQLCRNPFLKLADLPVLREVIFSASKILIVRCCKTVLLRVSTEPFVIKNEYIILFILSIL